MASLQKNGRLVMFENSNVTNLVTFGNLKKKKRMKKRFVTFENSNVTKW
jgi:hypothetical protein